MNIEELRDFCLSLPHTTEDIKWGSNLCFLIAEKMFCVTEVEGPFAASFKVDPEKFEELSTSPGIIPAPYLARNKWVLVTEGDALDGGEWEELVRASYEMVKAKLTKKVREKLKGP